ncbi:hypothetical protein EON68_00025 [archaeon]|nr:MAG: hypothetical protein EON68_00025 [archaeon]
MCLWGVQLIKDGGPLTDITSLIRSDFAVVARSEKAKVHALAEVTTCAAAFQPLGVGVLHWLRHTLLRPTSADDRYARLCAAPRWSLARGHHGTIPSTHTHASAYACRAGQRLR